MNKVAALVLCVLATTVTSEPIRFLQPNVKQEIPYEFCNDGSADFVGAATVDVNPYPIHIVSGSHIDITANIDILKAIEAGSKIDLKLKLQGALFDIPIPCLEVGAPVPIGSCTYDGSELLQLAQICPEHCPEGQASDLPLNPGHYGGPGLSIDIGDLPALLEPFLKGKIDVIAKLIDAAGNESICIKTTIELK